MRRKRREWLRDRCPPSVWLLVFFLVPTLIVFVARLQARRPLRRHRGGLDARDPAGPGPTRLPGHRLAHALAEPADHRRLVPAGPCPPATPSRGPRSARRTVLLLLVIVPFWTSFLIRIFAWKVAAAPRGPGQAGPRRRSAWSARRRSLLYNAGAVLLVMVYTFLPFAILPIYAAAEKFDFRLLEAARDLGARPLRAFRRVFLPGIRRGPADRHPGRLHPGARLVRRSPTSSAAPAAR